MPSRSRIQESSNPKATAFRGWRAMLIRKRGQILGWVEVRDRTAAELAAVSEFSLSDEQRKRLVVQERD